MRLTPDKISKLFDDDAGASLMVLYELRCAWRAACADHEDAWQAWCRGQGSHELVAATLDREEAGAQALAAYYRKLDGGSGAARRSAR